MKIIICTIIALLILVSLPVYAGTAAASFAVSVRVLPRCDTARLGATMQTANGRVICVYPRISEAPSVAKAPQFELQRTDKRADAADAVVRTVIY